MPSVPALDANLPAGEFLAPAFARYPLEVEIGRAHV